jgi:hypothetical protein
MIRGDLPQRSPEGPVPGEDLVAAIALKKTVAFVLYQPVVFAIVGPVVFLFAPALPPATQDAAIYGPLALVEGALLWAVAKGWLPATGTADVTPFSEKQLALGCHVLSGGAWLLGAGLKAEIVQWVVNGALVLGACVYFTAKSVLSRRLRWGVLSVLVLPAVQLAFQLLRPGR